MKNIFFYLLIGTILIPCGSCKNQEQAIASKKVLKAYQEWVYMKVKKGENWYESKWQSEFDKKPNQIMIDNCKPGLPDDFHDIRYGDINLDGKLDAIATIVPIPCDGGTAHRFETIRLVFISQEGSYKTSEAFNDIVSSIAITGNVDTITDEGTIIYTALEHGDEDAMCCPSKKTVVRFKYQNGGFVKIR